MLWARYPAALCLLVFVLAAGSAAGGDPAQAPPTAEEGPGSGERDREQVVPDCAAEMAARVQETYDEVRDLRARFRQRTHSAAFGAAGGTEPPTSGRVAFAKPGRMHWRYEQPEPSQVISDGATLWIYDPAAQEVQILEVGEAFLSAAAIQFLLGSGTLQGSFHITATGCGETQVQLHLLPKEAATYEWLELEVAAADGTILRTVVHDLLGNRTEVTFEDLERNPDLPESHFRFETPEGVRELRLPAP